MSKKKHHESHGGAWKVAYADFVTAMMALFMVLWISSQKEEILIATTKYFQNPYSSPLPASSGVMEGKKERVDSDENATPTRIFNPEMYAALVDEFMKLLDVARESKKQKPLEIRATADGILMIMYNREDQRIFEENSSRLTQWGEYMCQNMAWGIDRFHMRVRIDAHTPRGVVPMTESSDGWILTSDQANAIRQRLVHFGLEVSKIDRVGGFADTNPLKGIAPEDNANYRIELTLTATPETPRPAIKNKYRRDKPETRE